LIILIVAGFISLGLSFVPPDESDVKMAPHPFTGPINGTTANGTTAANKGRVSGQQAADAPIRIPSEDFGEINSDKKY
jgi:hypothetical protein